MKKLILVTSPPACGKTRLSKRLCTALDHVVYLDKDTLIPLSKQIFKVAGEPYDRSSAFFEANIRDYEYETILNLAFEALMRTPCSSTRRSHGKFATRRTFKICAQSSVNMAQSCALFGS